VNACVLYLTSVCCPTAHHIDSSLSNVYACVCVCVCLNVKTLWYQMFRHICYTVYLNLIYIIIFSSIILMFLLLFYLCILSFGSIALFTVMLIKHFFN